MAAIESFLVQNHTQRVQIWWYKSTEDDVDQVFLVVASLPLAVVNLKVAMKTQNPFWGGGVIAELCGRSLSVLISPPIWEHKEKQEAR
jgi:hypothetical protein